MAKALKIIIGIFICLISLASCQKYKKENGKIYFIVRGGDYNATHELEGADLDSFREIKFPDSFFCGEQIDLYAVDKNRVYRNHLPIAGADPESFAPIDQCYFTDGKHIFWQDEMMPNADPQTFRLIGDKHAMDADSVYFRSEAVPEADMETFTPLGHAYAKDKNHVYGYGHPRGEISDYETFRLLPDRKPRFWEIIMANDPNEMYNWACDKNFYYHKGRKIEGADYVTFTFFDDTGESDYAKDRYHVFYCPPFLDERPFIIEEADLETFEILVAYPYAKDKNHFYSWGRIITDDSDKIDREWVEYYKSRLQNETR